MLVTQVGYTGTSIPQFPLTSHENFSVSSFHCEGNSRHPSAVMSSTSFWWLYDNFRLLQCEALPHWRTFVILCCCSTHQYPILRARLHLFALITLLLRLFDCTRKPLFPIHQWIGYTKSPTPLSHCALSPFPYHLIFPISILSTILPTQYFQ